jgi:hypothetical protein
VAEPASAVHIGSYKRKICRRCWKTYHVQLNRPTADILRYTESAPGVSHLGIAPTVAAVAGLSALPCTVDNPGQYQSEMRRPDFQELKEHERLFAFLDIPTAGGVAALTIQLSDWVVFESKKWKPLKIENDLYVGISWAKCELYER